jgi:hypothetical protein
MCYYALVTLSTCGYGDIYPINNFEKVLGIIVILVGQTYFAFIQNSLIAILEKFDKSLENETSFELHNWMDLLSRFNDN